MAKYNYNTLKPEPVQSIIRLKKVGYDRPEYLIVYRVISGGVIEIIEGRLIQCDSIYIRVIESYLESREEISNIQIINAYREFVKNQVLTK